MGKCQGNVLTRPLMCLDMHLVLFWPIGGSFSKGKYTFYGIQKYGLKIQEIQKLGWTIANIVSRGFYGYKTWWGSVSWSPNSTDLYFWSLFVELAVATPVEWRNFVSVVPAAKKSQLGPIFFQNIRVIYKLSVKKQETGQKTGKKPPKKGVFISSSDQLAEPGHKSCQLLWPGSASWSEGLMKTPFFGGFLPVFCPVSCFFTDNLCMKCLFCKKNRPIWPSLAVEAPVTKFRHV